MSQIADMRVMVVDDTEANIDILVEALGDNYRVVVATDGESALEDIELNPPDLVLLDIMMPGLDGYEVCRQLKAKETTRHIPVIFLTALKEEGDEAKGLRLGAIDYITKPFNPELVKARVKNHLDLIRYRNHLEELVKERTKEIAKRQHVEFELRAAQQKIESELNIAAQIQKSFLPSSSPAFSENEAFELRAMMKPAREVGGDFYDFFLIDDERLVLTVADVSDKSIPAAMYMMVTRTMFRSLTRQIESPAQVFYEANNLICEENETCMFITAFLGFYDIKSGKLICANAGHHPAIVIGPQGINEEFRADKGMALGIETDTQYVETERILLPREIFFLYTDGVTEALSPQGKLFGVTRLKKNLAGNYEKSLSELMASVERELESFQQGCQFDDITTLALKRKI
jgi:serine phosphatase RsbU (regulator of sigma subunit)